MLKTVAPVLSNLCIKWFLFASMCYHCLFKLITNQGINVTVVFVALLETVNNYCCMRHTGTMLYYFITVSRKSTHMMHLNLQLKN